MKPARSRVEALHELGIFPAQVSDHIWENIAGMPHEKELIENKVLLALLHPRLAQKHGVTPPKSILLFGPPGTGKTTFSRGIASRLGWYFIEVTPGDLAYEGLGP